MRPREASELMVSGPVIGGDRYSEFTKRSVSQVIYVPNCSNDMVISAEMHSLTVLNKSISLAQKSTHRSPVRSNTLRQCLEGGV